VMKDGLFEHMGEPLELYNTPATKYVAGFIGSPAMNFANVTINNSNGALVAENSSFQIRVPDHLKNRLAPHLGKPATFGIRPEDLRMANGSDAPEYVFEGTVEVAEQLGSEILLDLKAGPNTMVASVDPTVRARPGDKVRLAVDPDRIHFFDGQTDVAL
jgi:multiple sugar transport system ATP-binding protein